jgi:hypothetical protein
MAWFLAAMGYVKRAYCGLHSFEGGMGLDMDFGAFPFRGRLFRPNCYPRVFFTAPGDLFVWKRNGRAQSVLRSRSWQTKRGAGARRSKIVSWALLCFSEFLLSFCFLLFFRPG